MTHSYVWHDSFMCVTWLIHMCDMTHSYVWHDSFICVAWLTLMCDMTHPSTCARSYVWRDSFIRVTRLIHIRDITRSYVWHDSSTSMCSVISDMTHSHTWHASFVYVTWPIHMCDTTHSHAWHDSFTCVPRLIHTCDTTHSHVWHDSLTRVTRLFHTQCDITHPPACAPLVCCWLRWRSASASASASARGWDQWRHPQPRLPFRGTVCADTPFLRANQIPICFHVRIYIHIYMCILAPARGWDQWRHTPIFLTFRGRVCADTPFLRANWFLLCLHAWSSIYIYIYEPIYWLQHAGE